MKFNIIKIIAVIVTAITVVNAQTLIAPDFTTSTSVADFRAHGWVGGQTITYTKDVGNFDPCTHWGLSLPNSASSDIHTNMNNLVAPPTNACNFNAASALTYSTGVGTSVLELIGTTQTYCRDLGENWITIPVQTKVLVTLSSGNWVNSGDYYLVDVAGTSSFSVNFQFQAFGPSGVTYQGTNYDGVWAPAILLFDELENDPNRSICTAHESNFYEYPELIVDNISGSGTICKNTNTALDVTYSGGVGPAIYQWQYSLDGTTGWTNVGGNTSSLTTSNLAADRYYKCIVSLSAFGCEQESNVHLVAVEDTAVGGNVSTDQVLCFNTNSTDITLSSNSASVINWEVDDNPNFATPTSIANATTTLTGAEIDANVVSPSSQMYFRAVVTNSCGAKASDSIYVKYNQPDPVILADGVGDCDVLSSPLNPWVHIYDNVTDKIICSIRSNFQDLGNVETKVFYHSGNALNVSTINGGCGTQAVLNRNFVINSANSFVNPVDVRFYFTDDELNDLITLAGCNDPNGCEDDDDVCSIGDLVVTQITGLPAIEEDGVFVAGDGTAILHGAPGNGGTGNASFSANYIDISVNSFSEFWIHGTEHGVPLPVELTKFTAIGVDDEYIQLDWETSTEINNDGFEVQKSTNGINFQTIAWVPGKGNSNVINSYTYNDFEAAKNITYYYKLKQVDFNGHFEFSDIVNARLISDEIFSIGEIKPNPSKGNHLINVDIISNKPENINVKIYDAVGAIVISEYHLLQVGDNSLNLSIEHLANGTYFINFEGSFGRETKRLVVVK